MSGVMNDGTEGRGRQQAPPRVSQILETSLYVDDLQRSRLFYERIFGFTTMFHDDRMCALEVPGEQVLLLFRHGKTDQPAPAPGGMIPPHHGQGALHLAFAIPLRALADWQDHLKRHDVSVEEYAQLASRRDQPVFPRSGRALAGGRDAWAVAQPVAAQQFYWRRRACGAPVGKI